MRHFLLDSANDVAIELLPPFQGSMECCAELRHSHYSSDEGFISGLTAARMTRFGSFDAPD